MNDSVCTMANPQTPSFSETDVMIGAYFITHLRDVCENCYTRNTPQWRKGWFNELLNRNVLLCNACGIKYAKSQYCPHCNYIYGKEHDKQAESWLTCCSCTRWVHLECEKRHLRGEAAKLGHIPVIGFVDPRGNILPQQYQCPGCRDLSPSQRNMMGSKEN